MNMENARFSSGDPVLIENIVNHLKARGIFDQFRHDSLADVDTKPSYQNLSQRVDGFVSKFLSCETWNPDQNKNELRNKLRRKIDESGMLSLGVDHVVDQVINPKIYQVFSPKIREVVEQYLGLREIPEENESKLKKQESMNESGVKTVKHSFESSDGDKTTKSVVSDPISEILALSDTTSKQKNILSSQTKISGTNVSVDNPNYVKKEDEKPKISLDIKAEVQDQSTESSIDSTFESKLQFEKETIKIKKETKSIERDVSSDSSKKSHKSVDHKPEIKGNLDDTKNRSQDLSSSEDNSSQSGTYKGSEMADLKSSTSRSSDSDDIKSSTNKSSDSSEMKSDSNAKIKTSDNDKLKAKAKPSSSQKDGSQKLTHASSELRKMKLKESAEAASPVKTSGEKLTKVPKSTKLQSKDHITPTKSSTASRTSKEVDGETKPGSSVKAADHHKKTISTVTVIHRKDSSASKNKNTSEKSESRVKCEQKKYPSDNIKSKSKTNSPISSSYESSQGSDQEKDSASKQHAKERRKLFSKGSKAENEEKSHKSFSDSKPSSHKSSMKTDKSDKTTHAADKYDSKLKKDKPVFEKHTKVQESSKIVSRSDSTKSSSSTCSTSDSSKETFYQSTESEGMDDSSSSKSDLEKRKGSQKQKKSCKESSNLNPPLPPPPPPSSGVSTAPSTSSSVESESYDSDDKQSSDENSSDESMSMSNSDENSTSNSSPVRQFDSSIESQKDEEHFLEDVPDIFLESSSDDEFSYFSTPEKVPKEQVCESDVTVSSVHTSDLSSFEDELSDSSIESESKSSSKENAEKKFNFENVSKAIQLNLKKRRRNGEKGSSISEEVLDNGILLNQSPEKPKTDEDCNSLLLESKRESRRERKLNPKYASEEYASIFNSSKRLKSISNPTNETPSQNDANVSNDTNVWKNKTKVHAQIKSTNELGFTEISNLKENEFFEESSLRPESNFTKNNNASHVNTLLPKSKEAHEDNERNKNCEHSNSSLEISDDSASSDTEASNSECQYTITLKIKKSPNKTKNSTLSSKVNDSSLSISTKSNEISAKIESSNHKPKTNSESGPLIENMLNENKPVSNGSKKTSDGGNVMRKNKRLHHDSDDDSVTVNLKRCKKDAYHEKQINSTSVYLRKKDNLKNKSNSQPCFQ